MVTGVFFSKFIEVGESKPRMQPLPKKDEEEKEAFSHAIFSTPKYKKLIRQGITKKIAVRIASKDIVIKKGRKWFSVSGLPKKLQIKAKKFWKR